MGVCACVCGLWRFNSKQNNVVKNKDGWLNAKEGERERETEREEELLHAGLVMDRDMGRGGCHTMSRLISREREITCIYQLLPPTYSLSRIQISNDSVSPLTSAPSLQPIDQALFLCLYLDQVRDEGPSVAPRVASFKGDDDPLSESHMVQSVWTDFGHAPADGTSAQATNPPCSCSHSSSPTASPSTVQDTGRVLCMACSQSSSRRTELLPLTTASEPEPVGVSREGRTTARTQVHRLHRLKRHPLRTRLAVQPPPITLPMIFLYA
jgi:hypothetical protein